MVSRGGAAVLDASVDVFSDFTLGIEISLILLGPAMLRYGLHPCCLETSANPVRRSVASRSVTLVWEFGGWSSEA